MRITFISSVYFFDCLLTEIKVSNLFLVSTDTNTSHIVLEK